MTPYQQHVYELHQSGVSLRQIARDLGKAYSGVNATYQRALRQSETDPAITATARAVGLSDSTRLSHYWDKVELSDGRKVSAFIKNDKSGADDVDTLAMIAEAFANVPPVSLKPADVRNDLMTVYPLYDMHIGMMAWARETRGQDYDLSLMHDDLVTSITTVQEYAPDSQDALIILGGDTIHINDGSNETPASRHKMDVDGRYEKVVDAAIDAICWAVDYLSLCHARVNVVVLRGNHDETSHIVLKAALKQRYRDTPHVAFPVVDAWDKSEIYWMKHGKSLIIMHHGDKAPPERLAMIAADKCPHWSDTRYRVILTGHLHSLKVRDMPGVTHYTLRSFCPPDAYGAMWGGVRGLSAMSFSATKGLVNTAHDPIERD